MPYINEFKKLAKQEWNLDVREKMLALTNYDEAHVPAYTLPSPLMKKDGTKVKTAFEWIMVQRPAIAGMFQKEMFGELPPRPDKTYYELLSCRKDALDGTAIRKEIRIYFLMNNGKSHSITMLLYIPGNASSPAPAFLGLNFKGNHSTSNEKDITPTGERFEPGFANEENRGIQTHRWHFKELISNGYAAATICYHDLFPDRYDGWQESIFELFENFSGFSGAHERFSSIGAWTWGLSRALDCLETEPGIDSSRVAVHGHSRLGKTSLWAGACDQRFKMVISNDSGCGGAAISRRMFGETYLFIVNAMPHWFVKGFRKYIANETNMPFDQHFLLALSAPRPIAIASATEDLWADPKGEFLSAYQAGDIYALFEAPVIKTAEMPKTNECITSAVSYHVREGKHDQTAFDWRHYIKIADKYL